MRLILKFAGRTLDVEFERSGNTTAELATASEPETTEPPSIVAGTTTYAGSEDTTMGFRMPSTDY